MSLTPTNLSEEDKKDEVEKQSDGLQLDSSSDEPDELAAKKRLYPFGSESESVKRAKMDPTLLWLILFKQIREIDDSEQEVNIWLKYNAI